MKRKFFIFILIFGVLFSFDCKEFMRYEKICPMQVLSEQKNTPPCHKKNNSPEKTDCNCKISEKAIAEKSEFKFQSPKVYFEKVLFENQFLQNQKVDFKFYSNKILNRPPIPLQLNTTTIRLLI